MERGATVNCIFAFPNTVNFEDIEAIRLLVRGANSNFLLTKSDDDVLFLSDNKISVFFTQEDTLYFEFDKALRLQWHLRYKGGAAQTSKIITTDIYEFLGRVPI